MPRISSRSHCVGPVLSQREPFTTSGALSAVGHAPSATGRLPAEWSAAYRADACDPGVVYVVLSYATPIAWVRADGQVIVPNETYSITTTRHQSVVRRWL